MLYRFDSIYKTNNNIEMHYTLDIKSVYSHTHDFYEFCFTVQNQALHVLDGKAVSCHTGDAIFIYPDNKHAIYSPDHTPLQVFNISFKKSLFDECWQFYFGNTEVSIPQIPITLSEKRRAEYQTLCTQFLLMSEPDKRFYEKKLVLDIIALFYRDTMNARDYFPDWLKNVIAYFNNPTNYMNATRFDEVYQLAGYSKPRFNRLFKEYLNKTPIEFYNECKIKHACTLLLETNLTIQYISAYLGFSSVSHFIHLFKSIMYCTPLQYRKNYFEENQA